ncbi:MAG: DinB family protein [Candidatus Hydrogenedentales bacterium]|jgi:uncharacterized damage-inducible protein DinB
MTGKLAADELRAERKLLRNILKDFKSAHADFRPTDGMMTVAQQVHHIAYTVKWFQEGAFGTGFSMEAENKKARTLEEATKELDAAYDGYIAFVEPLSEAVLHEPLPPNPIMQGPRLVVIGAQRDHTAHHRGALTVYLRLLGVTPTMVYAD